MWFLLFRVVELLFHGAKFALFLEADATIFRAKNTTFTDFLA